MSRVPRPRVPRCVAGTGLVLRPRQCQRNSSGGVWGRNAAFSKAPLEKKKKKGQVWGRRLSDSLRAGSRRGVAGRLRKVVCPGARVNACRRLKPPSCPAVTAIDHRQPGPVSPGPAARGEKTQVQKRGAASRGGGQRPTGERPATHRRRETRPSGPAAVLPTAHPRPAQTPSRGSPRRAEPPGADRDEPWPGAVWSIFAIEMIDFPTASRFSMKLCDFFLSFFSPHVSEIMHTLEGKRKP